MKQMFGIFLCDEQKRGTRNIMLIIHMTATVHSIFYESNNFARIQFKHTFFFPLCDIPNVSLDVIQNVYMYIYECAATKSQLKILIPDVIQIYIIYKFSLCTKTETDYQHHHDHSQCDLQSRIPQENAAMVSRYALSIHMKPDGMPQH